MRRPYHRPMPNTWWLKRWPYTKFMLREIAPVIVAVYLVILLVLIGKVRSGQAEYDAFMQTLKSPLAIAFHCVALVASIFHSVLWFNVTPQAMRVFRGEERVPPALLIGPNYALWVVLSVAVAFLFGLF